MPTPVVSTDYSFAASYNQDNNVNGDGNQPVGISAYYEGRAYGPSVVQNPDGTLTMVFAGYRFPKSIVSAGSVLGDQATGGSTGGATSPTWTVGSNDLNMYRSILTTTLSQSTSPGVATTTSVAASPDPATFGQTEVLTATVAPQAPGTGTPTGNVTFTGSGGTVLCQADLNESNPDTASCDYPYTAPTTDSVSATYAGDANYAGSASTTPASVTISQATPSTPSISNLPTSGIFGDGFTATVSTNGDGSHLGDLVDPGCLHGERALRLVRGCRTLHPDRAGRTGHGLHRGDGKPSELRGHPGPDGDRPGFVEQPERHRPARDHHRNGQRGRPIERDPDGCRHLQLRHDGHRTYLFLRR